MKMVNEGELKSIALQYINISRPDLQPIVERQSQKYLCVVKVIIRHFPLAK